MRPAAKLLGLVPLACIFLLASCGSSRTRSSATHGASGSSGPASVHVAAEQPSSTTEGTSSTPGAFPIPQMGSIGFRCDSAFRVQPFFDMRGAATTEEVTIRAPGITRRNFTTRIVGHNGTMPLRETTYSTEQVVALPFAHYRTVTFLVHGGSEARAITARATARFVAGVFKPKGDPPLGACYVKQWLVSMAVSPY